MADIPGVLAGTATAFAFQRGLGKDNAEAIRAASGPAVLSLIATASEAAPTPMRIAFILGLGATMGALSVMREQALEELSKKAQQSGP